MKKAIESHWTTCGSNHHWAKKNGHVGEPKFYEPCYNLENIIL